MRVPTLLLFTFSANAILISRPIPTFETFIVEFERTYAPGSEEYNMRKSLFEKRVVEIKEHNSDPENTWTKRVTPFVDRTEEELGQIRGSYDGEVRPLQNGVTAFRTLEQRFNASMKVNDFPVDFSWKAFLYSTREILDQKSCGSAWAAATTSVLRAHSELYQKLTRYSMQQLVSCTSNPRQCGGKGGCKGATSELAMNHVMTAGLKTEHEFPYTGQEDPCPAELKGKSRVMLSQTGGATLGMKGYHMLPRNKLKPLVQTLYEHGPVVVSLAVDDGFAFYDRGIYDGCKSRVVNHQGALIGWGENKGWNNKNKYWVIQNSFGRKWGEEGYMRLRRLTNADERTNCGWDTHPKAGGACKDEPGATYVCGTCGILYGSTVPDFKLSKDGWWSRKGHWASHD